MNIENFISQAEYRMDKPITEFSEPWTDKKKQDLKELLEYVKTGRIVIFTGKGFRLSYAKPHNCDCEYCEEVEKIDKYFNTKQEAEKELEKEFNDESWIENENIEEDYYFIKAVKQQPVNDGLFGGRS